MIDNTFFPVNAHPYWVTFNTSTDSRKQSFLNSSEKLFCFITLSTADYLYFSDRHLLCLFQVFYWTHLSYIWVWILLIIHCANFWKWFVVPGFVFLLEKIVGIAVSRIGGLYIVEVNLLPSKVHKTNLLSSGVLKWLQATKIRFSILKPWNLWIYF